MSKTLAPSVFATSRLSPPLSKSPHLMGSNTTLVSKTPFLIEDILHQHHSTTHNIKNNNNNTTTGSNFAPASLSVHGKPIGSFSTSINSVSNRNSDGGNNKSVNKSIANELAECANADNNNKETGRSNEGSLGIFHEAEQLIIRNAEEDYRRHIEG